MHGTDSAQMNTKEVPHNNYYKITFSPANPEIAAKASQAHIQSKEQTPTVQEPKRETRSVDSEKFPPSRWLDLMEEDFIEEPVDTETAIRNASVVTEILHLLHNVLLNYIANTLAKSLGPSWKSDVEWYQPTSNFQSS